MTAARTVVFEWPDAWVFASFRGAGDAAGRIDFAKLVATAETFMERAYQRYRTRLGA